MDMATGIHIHMGITGRHFTGTTVTASIITDTIGITGLGTNKNARSDFQPAGETIPAGYFFGEPEAGGTAVEVAGGTGC